MDRGDNRTDKEIEMLQIDRERDRQFYIIGWCALLSGALGCVIVFMTNFDPFRLLRPCMLHALTGYYCPGCGGTRAVRALLAGHLIRSFICHPIVPLTGALAGWFMVSQTIEHISKGRLRIGMHVRDIHLWGVLGIIVVNFLVKNLALLIWGVDLLA